MNDYCGVRGRDYVSLKNLKVEFRRDDGDADADDNGCFALCFWLYIDNCASFPSAILVQVFSICLRFSLSVKHGLFYCVFEFSISF